VKKDVNLSNIFGADYTIRKATIGEWSQMDCDKEVHHMNVRRSAGMSRAIKSKFT